MKFNNKYNELLEFFQSALYREFTLAVEGSQLQTAMNYAMTAGGKRFRPILAMAAAELIGFSAQSVLKFAMAIEVLHTSTLIHDDLPALDNDDLRRGKPTLHKAFNEALAVLGGDALIARAFKILSADDSLSSNARLAMLNLLANVFEQICEGQVLDLSRESVNLPEKLLQTHRNKTAALIQAALLGPVFLLENQGEQQRWISLLSKYGEALGMLFQIKDDLLDTSGKNADQRQGTQTFVSVFGKEAAQKKADQYTKEALATLSELGDSAWFFRAAVEFVEQRES